MVLVPLSGHWLSLSEAGRGAAGQPSWSSGTTLAGNAVFVTFESDGSCPDPASGFLDIKVPDHMRIVRVKTNLVRLDCSVTQSCPALLCARWGKLSPEQDYLLPVLFLPLP